MLVLIKNIKFSKSNYPTNKLRDILTTLLSLLFSSAHQIKRTTILVFARLFTQKLISRTSTNHPGIFTSRALSRHVININQ